MPVARSARCLLLLLGCLIHYSTFSGRVLRAIVLKRPFRDLLLILTLIIELMETFLIFLSSYIVRSLNTLMFDIIFSTVAMEGSMKAKDSHRSNMMIFYYMFQSGLNLIT